MEFKVEEKSFCFGVFSGAAAGTKLKRCQCQKTMKMTSGVFSVSSAY